MENPLHKSSILTAITLAVLPVCAAAQDVKLANCAGLSDQSVNDYAIAFTCVGLLREETERLQGALAAERTRLDALEARLEALETLPAENEALREQLGKVDTLDANLRRMNKALTDRPFVPASGTHPATRAVVAYTSEKGERTCPPGWSPYEPAKNRFILGAGDLYQTVGDTGGAAEVKLEERHLPPHEHEVKWHGEHTISLNKSRGNVAGDNQYRLDWFDTFEEGLAGDNMTAAATGGDQPHNNMPPYIALYFCVADG